jgi:hypothetical protein
MSRAWSTSTPSRSVPSGLRHHLGQLGLGSARLADHHDRVGAVLEQPAVERQQRRQLTARIALALLELPQHPHRVGGVVQGVEQAHRQAGVLATSSFTTPWHNDVEPLAMFGLVGFLMWLVWVTTYALVLLRGERAPAAQTERVVPVGATA